MDLGVVEVQRLAQQHRLLHTQPGQSDAEENRNDHNGEEDDHGADGAEDAEGEPAEEGGDTVGEAGGDGLGLEVEVEEGSDEGEEAGGDELHLDRHQLYHPTGRNREELVIAVVVLLVLGIFYRR